MNKTLKLFLIYLTTFTVLTLLIYIGYKHYAFYNSPVVINDSKIESSYLPKDNFKSNYTPKLNFNDAPVTNVNNITLNILSKKNIKNISTLLKSQRYYFPLNYIAKTVGYNLSKENNVITLNNNIHKITIKDSNYLLDSFKGSLRGGIISKGNEDYISISDIEELFNLKAIFNFKEKAISFYPDNTEKHENTSLRTDKKVAMMRFEDFTAGDSMMVDTNQAKVKFMADFLYSKDLKYHIAWIPRFKAPTDNIDNDLLSNNKFENVAFINLLDYLINKGGEVGLHGYTHQSGDKRSAVGVELSKDINSSESETRNVIENAIDTASALNIPVTFFESPHYRDTDTQEKIIGEYFQYLYEPKDFKTKNILKTKNNNLFVPTPLGFVENNDYSKITNGLINNNPYILKSFFYHPSIEVDYIDFNINDDKINFSFHPDSPLKNIVKVMDDNNYTTIHIDQLKK